jgi:hypothetical protein
MRAHPLFLLLVGGAIGWIGAASAQAADEKSERLRVARFVAQLGSSDFADREAATRALDAIGPPALEALHVAAHGSDAEMRRRAQDLIQHIERRAETARLLAPRRIHLLYKDTPVLDALTDFSRRSGVALDFVGDRGLLTERRLTLDTGLVSFWEAFERFCRESGVAEPVLFADGPERMAHRGTTQPQSPYEWNNPYTYPSPYGGADPSHLALVEGKPPVLATCRIGALQVRALPAHVSIAGHWPGGGEKLLPLEVSPEPGLAWQGVIGLRVTHAVDELGQELVQPVAFVGAAMNFQERFWGGGVRIWNNMSRYYDPYGQMGDPRHVPLQLRLGKYPARLGKQVEGVITAQMQTPLETLLTIDNPLQAAGQSVEGPQGASMKLIEAIREPNGQIKVRVQLAPPVEDPGVAAAAFGRNARFWAINRAAMGMRLTETAEMARLQLRGAHGQPFALVADSSSLDPQAFVNGPNQGPQEHRLTFQPAEDRGDPAQLVYLGRRTVVVEVPFTLKDVPLP